MVGAVLISSTVYGYPGEECDRALHLVERLARDIRIYEDSVDHNFRMAREKRESGDAQGANEELDYANLNMARVTDALAGFAGAVALAETVQCLDARINAAAVCGFNLSENC